MLAAATGRVSRGSLPGLKSFVTASHYACCFASKENSVVFPVEFPSENQVAPSAERTGNSFVPAVVATEEP